MARGESRSHRLRRERARQRRRESRRREHVGMDALGYMDDMLYGERYTDFISDRIFERLRAKGLLGDEAAEERDAHWIW